MYNVYKCNGCKSGEESPCLAFSTGKDITPTACLWWPDVRNDSNWVKDCSIEMKTSDSETIIKGV